MIMPENRVLDKAPGEQYSVVRTSCGGADGTRTHDPLLAKQVFALKSVLPISCGGGVGKLPDYFGTQGVGLLTTPVLACPIINYLSAGHAMYLSRDRDTFRCRLRRHTARFSG